MAEHTKQEAHSLKQSSFPVLLPAINYLDALLAGDAASRESSIGTVKPTADLAKLSVGDDKNSSPFMQGLLTEGRTTFTANGDLAFDTTGAVLVDLFHELEETIESGRLEKLLRTAWAEDPDATLRLIWNARSIHLGKSSRYGSYKALGWLAVNHSETFLYNLPWLVRPVIERVVSQEQQDAIKAKQGAGELINEKNVDEDSDFEMVDAAATPRQSRIEDDRAEVQYDAKFGYAHGYWKDLLNLLHLAANRQLSAKGKYRETLQAKGTKPKHRDWTAGHKREQIKDNHKKVTSFLKEEPVYRAFHMTVAKLFADQLRVDLQRLKSGKTSELKRISLAAKWAPSNKGSHDQNTFVVSTIAELLFPFGATTTAEERTAKLMEARIAYQSQILSPLRKHLDILERKLTDKTYSEIEYSRISSIAMRRYSKAFMAKDLKRFEQYLTDVAKGTARVSGAVLLPSLLIQTARTSQQTFYQADKSMVAMQQKIEQKLANDLLDGQWKTLVKRIKDSGKLQSAIAVCDVSGSMTGPRLPDKTTPLDSAIGLSLLLAEVVEPPFGGAFITFSESPHVVQVGGKNDTRSLQEKCQDMVRQDWGMNTDFVKIFEKLILPMAKKHKLKQEDMVKRVFVFSDMQFDHAGKKSDKWSTSYQRIQKEYAKAGYEMPELVFWDLASSRGSKPVTKADAGVSLVSGYSQAMIKVFLDGGSFDEKVVGEKEVVLAKDEKTGETIEVEVKDQMTPEKLMQKAIGHEAYRMLKVVD